MSEQTTITPEVMPDEQKEIALVVKQNGIQPETAQNLQQSFAPLFKEARDLIVQSSAVVVTDASQKIQIKLSREYRLAIRQTRIKGEKLHKSLKEEYTKTGRAIDALKTLFLHSLEGEEKRLDDQEKIVERAEAERKATLKASREEALRPFGIDTSFMSLADMPDATFAQLLENTRAGHEAKLAAAAKAEQDRIEAENARLKEQARIREENEKLRVEAARVAKEQEAAAAAWRAEKEAKEAQRRAEQEAAAKEAARLKAEAESAAEAARKEREALELQAAQERKAAEAKAKIAKDLADALAKKEREAREKVERELKAHREAEEARKRDAEAKEAQRVAAEQEAARRAAAAPDKDRLISFANHVRALEVPAFQSEPAKALSTVIASQIAKLATWLEEKSNSL